MLGDQCPVGACLPLPMTPLPAFIASRRCLSGSAAVGQPNQWLTALMNAFVGAPSTVTSSLSGVVLGLSVRFIVPSKPEIR